MALFENRSSDTEEIVGTDAATRALSVTVVENDFVSRVYENIAWFYDLTFGPALHPDRERGHLADKDRAHHRDRRHLLEQGRLTAFDLGLVNLGDHDPLARESMLQTVLTRTLFAGC